MFIEITEYSKYGHISGPALIDTNNITFVDCKSENIDNDVDPIWRIRYENTYDFYIKSSDYNKIKKIIFHKQDNLIDESI